MNFLAGIAATSLIAAPVAAADNPARSLSVAAARSGTDLGKAEAGLGSTRDILGAVIVVGLVAALVILISDDDDDGPDSN